LATLSNFKNFDLFYFKKMRIEGNTFFITGGASGLGAGCVEYFASKGANVVIADLNEKLGRALEEKIGRQALFVTCNITSEESVQAALNAAVARFGKINGCFNVAGISKPRRVLSGSGRVAPLDGWKFVIDVNLTGTFNVLRLASKAMIQTNADAEEKGVIINVASVAAFDGQIGQAAYSASKAGVVGMTLPIARDLAKWGIRICTIAPGMFSTAMTEQFPEKLYKSLVNQVQYPHRFGRPDEFAHACEFICTNQYMNGEVFRLDGSIRMGPR